MTDKENGFELKETRWVAELNANVYIYSHIRTGARLMHIDAEDTNKVFTIGFRTPPANHTGVAHILEHSVLCGSEKYPSKEPFVELIKGSLYTFLNAMTAKDFTLYPIASVNDKDFQILMEVYLDAVFFPNMRNIDEIFYQEGWHYDLVNKEDDLTIKGVVYNEMQGSFSDPISIIRQKQFETLFPDTVYKNCSGGIPECIPQLSLQEFRNFHQKYYHPSNSYIFLYGKMDVNNMLTIINNQALKRFTAMDVDSIIPPQPLFSKPTQTECTYPIAQNEDTTDKTWFSIDFLLDLQDDPALKFSFEVIIHLLLHTPAAPLKNAYLQAGVCKDVFGYFETSLKYPMFSLYIKGSNPEHAGQVKEIFFTTLGDLCKQGLDKQLIEASINIIEFHLREADTQGSPKGLFYIHNSLSEWIHDQDPITCLTYEDMLEATKKSLTTTLFEDIITKYILQNQHYVFITMLPEPGLSEKNHNVLKESLKQFKTTMSSEELERIISTTKKTIARQETPDTIDVLEKIPMLQISDVGKKAEDIGFIQSIRNDVNYLEHNIHTGGIVYLKLYFEHKGIPQKLLPYAKAIAFILGEIHTKNYHYSQLGNLVNIHTGGIHFDFDSVNNYSQEKRYRLFFKIKAKALISKTKNLVELLSEIVNNTLFEDANRLEEILNEIKSHFEMQLMGRGNNKFANTRLGAYFGEGRQLKEVINGVEFYFFIKQLLKEYHDNKQEIIENFQKAYGVLFNKKDLYVSITSPKEDIEMVQGELQPFIDSLASTITEPQQYQFNFCQPNEGFILPGSVQSVVKGFSFAQLGMEYSGDMEVLNIILNMDYLWNRIRVQGGAYGCSLSISPAGPIYASSYRDPNLAETLLCYDEMHSYLQEVNITDREFTKYIIGAIRDFDQPLTPAMKGEYRDMCFFSNKTQADCQRQRDQLLAASLSKIKTYTDMLRMIKEQNVFCVFGSEAKVKENSKLFSKVISVFE